MANTTLRNAQRYQQGLSLIELMVAMAIGVTLTLGMSALFSATMGSNAQSMRLMRVNQEVRTVAQLMISELRRAGFWVDVKTAVANVAAVPYGIHEVNASCILYSYQDTTVAAQHYRGFRLTGQVIEWMRSTSANDGCLTNTNGLWVPLTEAAETNVTALNFVDNSVCLNVTMYPETNCNPCTVNYVAWALGDKLVNTRQINLTISARPAGAADANMPVSNFQDAVLVRNEEVGYAQIAGPATNTNCGLKIPMTVAG